MPVFKKDGKTLLYIHIPKTGGTTVEAMFKKSGWAVHYTEYFGDNKLNDVRRCSPQHLHAQRLKDEFVLDKFDMIFATVRHPYARFRSEFCMQNFLHSPPSGDVVHRWAEQVFAQYADDPYLLDNHLRPQCEFILDNCRIFPLEQGMAAIRSELERRLDSPLYAGTIHELDQKVFSGLESRRVPLNQQTLALLERVYDRDFELGDYHRHEAQTRKSLGSSAAAQAAGQRG